ncbi:MAG TPA: sulfatase-like hydrolase/transferase [Thermoanaerobaculia bacterium]|nr:sulfatase-like hydrolase/transferase [Thermoanaerobaculia bacterium]
MSRRRKDKVERRELKAAKRGPLIAAIVGIVVVVVLAAAWFIQFRDATAAFHGEPDVILVTIDTLRADSVGYSGNSRVRTPFLDRIASEGIAFSNAHAHNVVTLPSHVNILTGLYPFQHGVRDNAGFVLEPRFPTVASMLREKGYATGAFVGAFPLDSRFGLNRGFDVYDDNYGKGETRQQFVVQERPARAVLTSAKKWYDSLGDRKRFLWIHLYDCHAPYKPPEPFATEFRDNPYLGEISAVDAALGDLLAPMLASGRDTLLIVTGDHGEALGDHGELTHGLFAYEATLKIPLIIREPGTVAHRVETGYVRHVDVVPTILDRLGMTPDPKLSGRSLLRDIDVRDTYFEALSGSLNRSWAPLTGVIHDGHKYIHLPIPELYELASDPSEVNNVVESRRRKMLIARELLARLTSASAQQTTTRKMSSEESARLMSLGYISGGGSQETTFRPEDDPKRLVGLDNKIHDVIEAYEKGDLAKALDLARQVLRERPQMPAARVLLAFVLEQSEQTAEAIDNLEALMREGRASTDAKIQLALLLSESGRAAEAIKLLEPIVLGGKETNPEAELTYGIALADQGKPQEANQQFERVLARDPNNAPALQDLGIVALRQDDLAAAREHLIRALDLNPKLPLALNTLGVVYARQGDLAAAVVSWQKAVDLDPHQYDALFNIGLVESRAGHRQEARAALTRFVKTAPAARYGADIAKARAALVQ